MAQSEVELDALAAGDDVATDLVTARHYQIIKPAFGALGTINVVTDTATNPFPVALSDTDNAVLDAIASDTGTIATDTTAIAAAVAAENAALGSGILLQGDDGTDRKNINVDATTGDVQVDVTNTVTVDGSGVTQPVSGTITANLSATDNAVLDSIQAAVEISDNTVKADDAAFVLTTDSVQMAGAIRDDSLSALSAVEGDAVPLRVSSTGALHVTGGGGGTEYNEDAATPATITGTATVMERDDALASLTPIEGDWAAMRCSAEGALWTQDFNSDAMTASLSAIDTSLNNIEASVGGNHVDDAAFTLGTDEGVMIMGFAGTQLVDANDAAALSCQTDGSLNVNITGDDVGIGGGTQYTEDAAAAANPVGNANVLIREDARAGSLTTTDGDNVAQRGNNFGDAYVHDTIATAVLTTIDTDTGVIAGDTTSIDSKITACDTGAVVISSGTVTANLSATDNAVLDTIETNTDYGTVTGNGTAAGALRVSIASDTTGVVSIDDNGSSITVDGTVGISGTVTVDLGANNDVTTTGNVAHDAADSGNPSKIGGKAVAHDGTAPGTDVAENDRTDAKFTVWGAQYVETAHPNYWRASSDYASAQTNATVKTAPGAGLKLYITDVIVSNGATAGNITLLDGSGGTVLLELYPAINGGLTHSFRTPLALTANTLLAITSTTVTTHSVTVSGYIAA